MDAKLQDIAFRHGVSQEAVELLFYALQQGGGNMAQFSHPELGGMGQWSSGMLMIGDLSNLELKKRVQSICQELSKLLTDRVTEEIKPMDFKPFKPFKPMEPMDSEKWWPEALGVPSSVGGQNDSRYAYFPATHRLAVEQNSHVTIYDTGEHKIHAASQQQGESNSLVFDSQLGRISVADFKEVKAN